jgi:hypothetical protein
VDTLIEQVAVTDMTDTPIMDQGTWFKTAPAARQSRGEWLQGNRQDIFGVLAAGYDRVAWPESGKINRIHGGSRGWCVLRLPIYLRP